MDDARAKIQGWIERIRALPVALAIESAPLVADALREDLEENISLEIGPDGKGWQRTKSGDPALQNASNALNVRAVGSVILATLSGPEVKHHKGTAKGGVKRPILPTRSIPDPVAKAIHEILSEKFQGLIHG